MAVNATAVVNIDVNDAKFKAFLSAFNQFQKALGTTPTAWKQMSADLNKLTQAFTAGTNQLVQQAALMNKLAAHTKTVAVHSEHSHKHWKEIVKHGKELGHHVIHITHSLMKWGGIITGLMTGTGIAGFFGLDRLAEFVRGGRISATGAGLKDNELRALKTQFGGPLGINMESVARGAATGAEDQGSAAYHTLAGGLGLDPTKSSGSKRVMDIMERLRQMMKAGWSPERLAQSFDTQSIGFGSSELRNLHELSDDEFNKKRQKVGKEEEQYKIDPKVKKEWDAFLIELEHATERMQIILVKHLSPILKAFTAHGDKWMDDLDEFLSKPAMKKFIKEFPDLLDKIWEFMTGFAGSLEWVGKKLGWIKRTEAEDKEHQYQMKWWGLDSTPFTKEERERFDKEGADNRAAIGKWVNGVWVKGKGAVVGGYNSVMGGTAYDVVGHGKTIGDLSDSTGTTKFFEDMGKSLWKGWMEGMQYFGSIGKPEPPKLQDGTPFVPKTGTFTLHRGEMVLPEKDAEVVRRSTMEDWKRSISGIESAGSGGYSAVNPKSGATGKYQVMPANIPSWTKQALGRSMSQQEFLRDHQAQERVFETIFGQYVRQFGNPIDAASAWFTGRPMAGNKSGPDAMGTTLPGYVQRFLSGLGGSGASGSINLSVNDNTGGNVALSLEQMAVAGPLPIFPL